MAEATACKAVYAGSIPASASVLPGATSSVEERYLDTVEAGGSIPPSPTHDPSKRSAGWPGRDAFFVFAAQLCPRASGTCHLWR